MIKWKQIDDEDFISISIMGGAIVLQRNETEVCLVKRIGSRWGCVGIDYLGQEINQVQDDFTSLKKLIDVAVNQWAYTPYLIFNDKELIQFYKPYIEEIERGLIMRKIK